MFDGVGKDEIMEAKRTMFAKSFFLMFIGLMITAIASFAWIMIFPGINGTIVTMLSMLEIVVVFVLIAKIEKFSTGVATTWFIIYSILNGITISSIFIYYELSSIVYTFLISAVMFLIMALYGYFTKRDLSKLAPYLVVSLLGCLVVLIINIFIGSSTVDIIASLVVIVTVMLVTAWDIYTMKHSNLYFMNNAHIYFALSLYLDFINIFLYLLKFLGKKK